MSHVTQHLRIYGKVQGVFFRESMRKKALELSVHGWVRNRLDGSVEAVVYGNPQQVQKLVEWAYIGPELAKVTQVEIEETQGVYAGFEKKETV
jgi:acylphosphatase